MYSDFFETKYDGPCCGEGLPYVYGGIVLTWKEIREEIAAPDSGGHSISFGQLLILISPVDVPLTLAADTVLLPVATTIDIHRRCKCERIQRKYGCFRDSQ